MTLKKVILGKVPCFKIYHVHIPTIFELLFFHSFSFISVGNSDVERIIDKFHGTRLRDKKIIVQLPYKDEEADTVSQPTYQTGHLRGLNSDQLDLSSCESLPQRLEQSLAYGASQPGQRRYNVQWFFNFETSHSVTNIWSQIPCGFKMAVYNT